MRPRLFPSAEARRIIEATPAPLPDRSAAGLPGLRREAKARAVADAPRILQAAGVTSRDTMMSGVRCLDLHPPEPRATWLILYGFGGGFVQGSPEEELSIAAPLCALAGARVIIPDYRLAPEHPAPAAVQDGFAVYREVAEHPFALVGDSAGGNLALALMQRARAQGVPLPGAAALLSPWCDLTNPGESLIFNDGRDPSLSPQSAFQAARHYAGETPLDDPGISPIHGAFDPGFPPFVITTGTRDLHLSQAVRLAQVLADHGVRAELQAWEGLWHVFEWFDQLPEARQSLDRIAAHLHANMTA